mmetsp:Transcript_19077/g.62160  ORF Transcript_19077/g.62160 Transcript_19077/m.62160 type:complete len:160 (-) Transcript_19077:735-1214(-)
MKQRLDHSVSLSAFAHLFSEIVQYQSTRIQTAADLECRLEECGHSVGLRILELLSHRERRVKHEIQIVGALQFVSSHCWKALFGKVADSLERSTENENECAFLLYHRLELYPYSVDMIHETFPVTNQYVSVPPDLGHLNCAAYIAGVASGILDGANFVR